MSIGISMMIEGVKDMYTSIYSAVKGIDIDWGSWGKDKLVSYALTFAFAGTAAIKSVCQLAKTGI